MRKILLTVAIVFLSSHAYAEQNVNTYITSLINFTDKAVLFSEQISSQDSCPAFLKDASLNFSLANNELRELKEQVESNPPIDQAYIKLKLDNIIFDLCDRFNLPAKSIKGKTDKLISASGIDCEQIYIVSMAAMLVGVGLMQIFIIFSDLFFFFGLFWGIIGLGIGLFGMLLAPIAIICVPFIFL